MPLRAMVTKGTKAACKQAASLIDGIPGKRLIADRGYDTNQVVHQVKSQSRAVVISTKKNRNSVRPYDKACYKLRHLVENAFLHPKPWCGQARRYVKKARSFLAAIQIGCIALWANIS